MAKKYATFNADGTLALRLVEGINEIPKGAVEVDDDLWARMVQENDGIWAMSDGGKISKGPLPEVPQPVPASVTMMQARLAMLNAGILSDVEAAIAAMTGDEGKAAQIQWQFAQQVRRDWPLVASLQKVLKLSDKAADDLFIAAAAIE